MAEKPWPQARKAWWLNGHKAFSLKKQTVIRGCTVGAHRNESILPGLKIGEFRPILMIREFRPILALSRLYDRMV